MSTVAKLRNTTVVLPEASWAKTTWSRQNNQNRDIAAALDCIVLPSHVRRCTTWRPREDGKPSPDETGQPVTPVAFLTGKKAFFRRGVVLPHPVPGFPQWAIPELAQRAFQLLDPHVANLTLVKYLQVMRSVSDEMRASSRCVPSAALDSMPHQALALAKPRLALKPKSGPVRVCLHLRRRDAWSAAREANDTSASRSTAFVKTLTDTSRERFTNRTSRAVLRIIELLDEAHQADGREEAPPASWLIVSDDVSATSRYSARMTPKTREQSTPR